MWSRLLREEQNILEIKVLGIVTYIQTSSVRRTARILSELHPVSKTAVWNWIKKFEEKLPISAERKQRNLIAIDETVVKARKKKYYVYSAVDVERNELVLIKAGETSSPVKLTPMAGYFGTSFFDLSRTTTTAMIAAIAPITGRITFIFLHLTASTKYQVIILQIVWI